MSDRPIIFSAPMVRALLDGRKTQTRRVLKPQLPLSRIVPIDDGSAGHGWFGDEEGGIRFFCGYAPGDRLWVREAWGMNHGGYDVPALIPKQRPARDKLRDDQLVYFATETDSEILAEMPRRPSIHMPRWASRLTLAVTDVRVERLREIDLDDVLAEGITPIGEDDGDGGATIADSDTINEFRILWESLHGAGAWAANPWVVAITFDVHRCNIDEIDAAP